MLFQNFHDFIKHSNNGSQASSPYDNNIKSHLSLKPKRPCHELKSAKLLEPDPPQIVSPTVSEVLGVMPYKCPGLITSFILASLSFFWTILLLGTTVLAWWPLLIHLSCGLKERLVLLQIPLHRLWWNCTFKKTCLEASGKRKLKTSMKSRYL